MKRIITAFVLILALLLSACSGFSDGKEEARLDALSLQNAGVGSRIVGDLCAALRDEGFSAVRLGRAKGNPQPERFWRKNGFRETGVEYDAGGYTVIVLQRDLRPDGAAAGPSFSE